MEQRIEHVASFVATDAKGNRYTINEFRKVTERMVLSGQRSVTRGLPDYQTQDGKHVNKLGGGKFTILGDIEDIEVMSDDPAAS